MQQTEWDALLIELEAQTPELVQTFLHELAERGLYDSETVPPADLATTAEAALRMLVQRLGGKNPGLGDFASDLGRRRARQGVPLEQLLDAIRLDLRIIWQKLLDLSEPEHAVLIVQQVARLIELVEGYVSEVQQSFLEELAMLQRDSRLATERHLSKLFNAERLSAPLIEEISAGLDLDGDSVFELLYVPPAEIERVQREFPERLHSTGVLSYGYRGSLLLFRPSPDALSSWPREFASVPSVYIHRIDGVGQVPTAARAATQLHTVAGPLSGLTDVERLWASGACAYLEGLVPGYFSEILAPLAELANDDREKVLTTVGAFLTNGSIKDTAATMACHRNTVMNRFRQFQTLTGLDPAIPADAALIHVLFAGSMTERIPPSN